MKPTQAFTGHECWQQNEDTILLKVKKHYRRTMEETRGAEQGFA